MRTVGPVSDGICFSSRTPPARRPPQEEERTGALSVLYTKTIYVIDPPFPCCCCFFYLICVSRVFKKKKTFIFWCLCIRFPPSFGLWPAVFTPNEKEKKESCCVMGPSFVVCVGVASCIRLLTDVYVYRLTRWNRWGPSTEMFAQQFGPNNTRDASQRKGKRISHATTDLYLIYFPPRLQEGRPRSFHSLRCERQVESVFPPVTTRFLHPVLRNEVLTILQHVFNNISPLFFFYLKNKSNKTRTYNLISDGTVMVLFYLGWYSSPSPRLGEIYIFLRVLFMSL